MDNKFERIVREPFVMGGQARIRDTNITVNEIVRLSLDGMSQAEILAKYPQLEAEDIYQALAYGMNDLTQTVAIWSREILMPLTTAIGYSDLMANKAPYPLDNDKPQSKEILNAAPQVIFENAHIAKARMQHFRRWYTVMYLQTIPSEPLSLHPTLDDAIREARQLLPKTDITTDIFMTEQEIEVTASGFTSSALAYLLAGGYCFTYQAQIMVAISNNLVRFVITRYVNDESVFDLKGFDFMSSGHLQLANLIIFKSSSTLKIRQEGNKVTFEFELPIWQGEQD